MSCLLTVSTLCIVVYNIPSIKLLFNLRRALVAVNHGHLKNTNPSTPLENTHILTTSLMDREQSVYVKTNRENDKGYAYEVPNNAFEFLFVDFT